MSAKRRLTPEEWAMARYRWEGSPLDGFDWLAKEISTSLGVEISRQAVAKMAGKRGWAKGGEPSKPLPVEAQRQVAQPVEVAQANAATISHASQVARPASAHQVSVARLPAAGRTTSDDTGLTQQKEQFAGLLAAGMNQSAAYLATFPNAKTWKPESVYAEASKLAASPKVATRVQELMAGAASATQVDVTTVLREYLKRLQADPRELSHIRLAPCRHCHGTDHLYQYSDGELRRKMRAHEEKRQTMIDAGKRDIGDFDQQGGGGYNVNQKPNAECPDCGGAGIARTILPDSRDYSPEALALFVSAHESKEGIKVNVNDRDAALRQIARHVGFYEADKDPAATFTFNIAEADALYERALAKSAADAAAAKGRMARLRAAGVDVGRLPGDAE